MKAQSTTKLSIALLAAWLVAQTSAYSHPGKTASSMAALGGTALTATLAPVEQAHTLLIAGVQFDEKMLPAPEPTDNWYWIPGWFAGTWHRESVTRVSDYDYKACTEVSAGCKETACADDVEGWQQDNAGEYWNCQHTPFRSDSLGERCHQIFVVTSVKPLEVTQDHVTEAFEGTGVMIDNATGKVIHSAKARSIETYRLIEPGLVSCSSITTELDSTGEPTSFSKTTSTLRKTAEFKAHDLHAGKDMRISFKKFLSAQGKSNRVPLALSALDVPADTLAMNR